MEESTSLGQIPVTCGNLKAIFYPGSLEAEVEVNGEVKRVNAAQLERLSDRAYMKKWRVSIQVPINHFESISIGTWLHRNKKTSTKCDKSALEKTSEAQNSILETIESQKIQTTSKESIQQRMDAAILSCSFYTGPSDPDVTPPGKLKHIQSKEQKTFVDYRKMTETAMKVYYENESRKGCLYKSERRIQRRKKSNSKKRQKSPELLVEAPDPAVVNSIGRKRRKEGFLTLNYRQNPTSCEAGNEDELLFDMLDAAGSFSLNSVKVTLGDLYNQVEKLGGYETIVTKEKWALVAQELKLTSGPTSTDIEIVHWVEKLYKENLLSFNEFMNNEETSNKSVAEESKHQETACSTPTTISIE
eukprot:g7006.t1